MVEMVGEQLRATCKGGGGEPGRPVASCLSLFLSLSLPHSLLLNSHSPWVHFLAPLLADCDVGHCLNLLGLRSS